MEKWLQPKEAELWFKELGMPFTTGVMGTWRHIGRGPKYRKVSGKIFYRESDLRAFVDGDSSEIE